MVMLRMRERGVLLEGEAEEEEEEVEEEEAENVGEVERLWFDMLGKGSGSCCD